MNQLADDQLREFVRRLQDGGVEFEQLMPEGFALLEHIAGQGVDASRRALDELGRAISTPDSRRAALATLLCGSLVENGAWSAEVADAAIAGLETLLPRADQLVKQCLDRLRDVAEPEREPRFREVLGGLIREQPARAEVGAAFDLLWRPAIVFLSRDAALRHRARPLLDVARRIAPFHEGGHWLAQLLEVLDDEPLLVLEPAARRGLTGRLSGVADNFQLHLLLIDALDGELPGPLLSVAQGRGPQLTAQQVTDKWNLYSYRALRADLTLPAANAPEGQTHGICREQIPADIPRFQDHRVVLLGPSSDSRSWPVQRQFAHLPAAIREIARLDEGQTAEWLERLAAANAGSAAPP